MKKREKNTESVGDVIKNMVDRYNLKKGMDQAQIKGLWETFLGRELDVHTQWIRLKEGILYAQMKDSTARHEVFMQRTSLREFINQELGNEVIKEIRLL